MVKILLFLLMLLPISSFAEDSIILDDLFVRLQQHPIILNKQQSAKYYQQLSKKEKGLPDPGISLGVENVPVDNPAFNRYLPTSKTIGFSQKIPAFSIRKYKSDIQKHLSNSEDLSSKFIFENLKMRLLTALINKKQAQSLIELSHKQLELLSAKEKYLQGRLGSGGQNVYSRLSENDIDKSTVEQQISNLEFSENEADLELINLVGEVPLINKLPELTMNNWNEEDLQDILPILAVKEKLQAAKSEVKVKKASFGPNLEINGKYKIREAGNNFDGDNWFSAGIDLSIPLWFSSSQLPDLKAANARQSQISADYKTQILNWQQEINLTKQGLQTSQKNIKLLEDKQNSLSNMVAAVSRNYEAGRAAYESVLDAKIYKMRILSDLEREKANYQKLIARFNNYTAK